MAAFRQKSATGALICSLEHKRKLRILHAFHCVVPEPHAEGVAAREDKHVNRSALLSPDHYFMCANEVIQFSQLFFVQVEYSFYKVCRLLVDKFDPGVSPKKSGENRF